MIEEDEHGTCCCIYSVQQLDPYLFVNILSYLPYFYQHVFKRVSKNMNQAITNYHHDKIIENYYKTSSLEIHDLKLVELDDYFKYKLHFKMQNPIQIATLLKKMYYLNNVKWMEKYRAVEKYRSILKNKFCLKINVTLVGCEEVTCQYLNELEKQFRDHSVESVDCYFSNFDMSDGWKYNFSCNCFSTSAFYRNSLVYNEYSYTRINTESPKINSLEGFETYFKKCADNLGICVSLLPKPTVISHQLFMKNSATGSIQFDWGQALFVLRNKIISTCEPALIASNVTCSIYSFLFQPVQKLALNTYLRANKPQQFIKEYQAFMKHESVVKCLDKFQVLLEIAKENEHEVQFILSKKFTTTPLYILELLDTLTISKHKELCKQVSIIPPNNANKKKKQDKDFSFKNFKLFNWRNDLLLKCLNISEEEFHNMKRAIMSTSINNRLFSH